ncbi:MAG: hypothetical protein ACRD2R_00455, partial [Terriglobales bacterium]
MKDQYFGDINDYRKYGILRCLAHAGLPLGVHWMLTPGDAGIDGRKLAYLKSPARWRHHDPPLFDLLAAAVRSATRSVDVLEAARLLPEAYFFTE